MLLINTLPEYLDKVEELYYNNRVSPQKIRN